MIFSCLITLIKTEIIKDITIAGFFHRQCAENRKNRKMYVINFNEELVSFIKKDVCILIVHLHNKREAFIRNEYLGKKCVFLH